MALQLDLLPDAPAPVGHETGQPLLVPIDRVDENPEQPRQEFDPETLRELADTIAQRGVRQPISVRPHPADARRWILNFGARRLRASRLAGKTEIPAFVDETADTYDQVIENEQREGLKPLELALFIQRRLDAGENRVEIARRLGKSPSYVTLACALIDAPDWLMALYREGRCRGMLELHELRRLHRDHPQKVEEWASAQTSIGRSEFERLKESLLSAEKTLAPERATPVGGVGDDQRAQPSDPAKLQPAPQRRSEQPSEPLMVSTKKSASPSSGFGSARTVLSDVGLESRQTPNGPCESGLRTPHVSGGFEPLKGLAEARQTASTALLMLTRVIALMEATPVGGPEALRELRARLTELATPRDAALADVSSTAIGR